MPRCFLLGVLLLGAARASDVAERELFCPVGLVDTLVSKAIAGEEIDAVPLSDSCEYREAASVGFLQVDAPLPSAQEAAKETCVTCDSSSGCDQGSFYKLIEPLSEGKTQDIDCGQSFSVKEVTTASFGWPMGTAINFVKHPDMDDPGAKGMIEMDCKGKQLCTIHSAASEGWDPKPGRGRWLIAKIRCAKARPAPNPVCCPAGMYIQPGAAKPKDTICIGHNSSLDTPCGMFNAAEVRPCKVPTLKTCFKTCLNVDKVSDGSESGQSLGLGNLMCSKVCIKVMANAQKHKFDNLEMVDWPAKEVHLDSAKTAAAAAAIKKAKASVAAALAAGTTPDPADVAASQLRPDGTFDKEAAEKNCAMKPGDTIKTCCEDGMTLVPGEAGGAPMCTGGGKPECVLWSTSRRRRLLAQVEAPSICNSQEPARGPVPTPPAAASLRWTDKTTCTAAVTWKDPSVKKLSPAEQAEAEANPAYKKPVFTTYVTGVTPGTRVKFSGCHDEDERVALLNGGAKVPTLPNAPGDPLAAKDIKQAKAMVKQLTLQQGSTDGSFPFDGSVKPGPEPNIKGLYAYPSDHSAHANRAFWGSGGSEEEVTKQLAGNGRTGGAYRPVVPPTWPAPKGFTIDAVGYSCSSPPAAPAASSPFDEKNNFWYICGSSSYAMYDDNTLNPKQKALVLQRYPDLAGRPDQYAAVQGGKSLKDCKQGGASQQMAGFVGVPPVVVVDTSPLVTAAECAVTCKDKPYAEYTIDKQKCTCRDTCSYVLKAGVHIFSNNKVTEQVKSPLFWANRNEKCDGRFACQGIKGKCDWCGYHGKCCKQGESSDDGTCGPKDGCIGEACCVSHDPKLDMPPKPVTLQACNKAGELSRSIVDFKTGEVVAAGPCCGDKNAEIISLMFDTSQCTTPEDDTYKPTPYSLTSSEIKSMLPKPIGEGVSASQDSDEHWVNKCRESCSKDEKNKCYTCIWHHTGLPGGDMTAAAPGNQACYLQKNLKCIGPEEDIGSEAKWPNGGYCPPMGHNAEDDTAQMMRCESYGNTKYRCLFIDHTAPMSNECLSKPISTRSVYPFVNDGADPNKGRKPELVVKDYLILHG